MKFSPFEAATRSAIEEIVMNHVSESRFGYVLTRDKLAALSDDMFDFFRASRELKDLGDRMLGGGVSASASRRVDGGRKRF